MKHGKISKCTFCGSEPDICYEYDYIDDREPVSIEVYCDYCWKISAYGDTKKEAISEWNRKCDQAGKL